MFAYTNAEVSQLNVDLRQVRRDRGELAGPDVRFATKHGPADFAVGDRVQFTDTDKRLHIYNGNAGVIIGIDARSGQVTARLDAAAGMPGREVTWSAAEFPGFRHGYAGTIYKGQGRTLDHTYLLHSHHWRSSASYVALTRQRESAQVFVATETARDARQLARQMARGEMRAASVAWATADELTPARAGGTAASGGGQGAREVLAARQPAGHERHPARDYWRRTAETVSPNGARRGMARRVAPRRAGAAKISGGRVADPAALSPDGRDSLGRGLDAGAVRPR